MGECWTSMKETNINQHEEWLLCCLPTGAASHGVMWQVFDNGFCFYFTLELIIRCFVFGTWDGTMVGHAHITQCRIAEHGQRFVESVFALLKARVAEVKGMHTCFQSVFSRSWDEIEVLHVNMGQCDDNVAFVEFLVHWCQGSTVSHENHYGEWWCSYALFLIVDGSEILHNNWQMNQFVQYLGWRSPSITLQHPPFANWDHPKIK